MKSISMSLRKTNKTWLHLQNCLIHKHVHRFRQNYKMTVCLILSNKIIIGLLSVGMMVVILKHIGLGVSYQGSPSMPIGFYGILPAHQLRRGEAVVFHPPPHIQQLLITRGWLPPHALLMKYVMGVPGDHVCKKKQAIWINDKKIATVFQYDSQHQPLPSHPFCETLPKHYYLLMSLKVPHSFDGRYFGPIDQSMIIGRAVKLFHA